MMTRNLHPTKAPQNVLRRALCAFHRSLFALRSKPSALCSQPFALRRLRKNFLHATSSFFILTSALAQTPDTARIELPDQRTYWSKTYYNAKDNNYTTTISAGYIHYQASDGTYKDIDTNLRPAGGGAYQVTDGLYQVRFAGAAGQKAGYDVDCELPKPVKPKFRANCDEFMFY